MKMKGLSEGFNALRLKMYLIIQIYQMQNDSMCTLRPRYDVSKNNVGDNGISLTKNRSAFPAKSFEIHSRLGVLDKPVADTEDRDESRISTANIDDVNPGNRIHYLQGTKSPASKTLSNENVWK